MCAALAFFACECQAPHIQLIRWESLTDSEWQLRWAPSWSVQVAVEGSQYLSFSLTLRLFDFRVSGRLKFRATPDLSTIVLSFVQMPKLRLKTECTVSWGSVALPLQTYIEQVVQDEFQRWTKDNCVAPHEMVLNPASFQPKKGLTDADVEKVRSRRRTWPRLGSHRASPHPPLTLPPLTLLLPSSTQAIRAVTLARELSSAQQGSSYGATSPQPNYGSS